MGTECTIHNDRDLYNSDWVLKHKLGECIWWLTVLADRMDININESVDHFLKKEKNY